MARPGSTRFANGLAGRRAFSHYAADDVARAAGPDDAKTPSLRPAQAGSVAERRVFADVGASEWKGRFRRRGSDESAPRDGKRDAPAYRLSGSADDCLALERAGNAGLHEAGVASDRAFGPVSARSRAPGEGALAMLAGAPIDDVYVDVEPLASCVRTIERRPSTALSADAYCDADALFDRDWMRLVGFATAAPAIAMQERRLLTEAAGDSRTATAAWQDEIRYFEGDPVELVSAEPALPDLSDQVLSIADRRSEFASGADFSPRSAIWRKLEQTTASLPAASTAEKAERADLGVTATRIALGGRARGVRPADKSPEGDWPRVAIRRRRHRFAAGERWRADPILRQLSESGARARPPPEVENIPILGG